MVSSTSCSVMKNMSLTRVHFERLRRHLDYEMDDDDDYELQERVWSGERIHPAAAPFAASIIHLDESNKNYFFVCSGSFVTPRVVITCAHCFRKEPDLEGYLIRSGTREPLKEGYSSKLIGVYPPSEYDVDDFSTAFADIAVVILAQPVTNIGTQQVLTLPLQADQQKYINKNISITFVSSGSTFTSHKPYLLKRIKINFLTANCVQWWKNLRPEYQFCNNPNDDLIACEGDSGAAYWTATPRGNTILAIQQAIDPLCHGPQPPPGTKGAIVAINIFAHMKHILTEIAEHAPWNHMKDVYQDWELQHLIESTAT